MTINVTTDTEVAEPGPVPAAIGSPLFDLRQRRGEINARLYLDLQVPRWHDDGGPEIWVRYRPARAVTAQKSIQRRAEKKDDEALINTEADVLVEACVGVYAKVGEQTFSLRVGDAEGTWTRFDQDLAVALGLDPNDKETTAAATCRALYFTELDLISAASDLGAWSGQASKKAEEEALGE